MRVTNRMLQTGALGSIQKNMAGVADAQTQIATGKKLTRASDNPTSAASAMHTRGSLRALDTYRRAIDYASQRASLEESALEGLSDTLIRAKEIAVTQVSGGSNDATRFAARGEVDQLLRHGVQLANTAFGDGYLFAGIKASEAPFSVEEDAAAGTVGYTTTNPTGEHRVAISSRQQILANRNGSEVFIDTDALDSIQELSQALESGDQERIQTAMGRIDRAFESVQNLMSDTGARVSQMQITMDGFDATEAHLLEFRSDLEDVEVEEAMTELVTRQTAYQAAMMASSRVMGLTIANYL